MTQYQVDSEAVLGSASAIRTTVDRIQTEVSGLHGQLAALQGSWSGQAAAAFQGIVNDWHSTQVRVEESLASINQALAMAGRQYAEVELSNARLFAA